MAESEGTAEIESRVSDIVASAAAEHAAAEDGDDSDLDVENRVAAGESGDALEESAEGEEEEEKPPEPPRRRLVAELLEGEDSLDEFSDYGAQLVAPPLHVECADTGQPVYQLDLSADEPHGAIVAPEPPDESGGMISVAVPAEQLDPYGAAVPAAIGAYQTVKEMIVDRERRVMAAERDGIGAYELAVELDDFVRALVDALRQAED